MRKRDNSPTQPDSAIHIAGKPSALLKETASRPYQPSWVDQMNGWVERLPIPAWMFYGFLWLVLIILESSGKWLDGLQDFGQVRWINVLYSFYGVYFLAAIHYLDFYAHIAFDRFRSIMADEEPKQVQLLYHLTTMPARTVWILNAFTIMIVAALFRPLITPLWESMGFEHNSLASKLFDLGIFAFNTLSVVTFVYHTLRQLRWISNVHKKATQIDLFQLRPAYSFSGLTARTAGILLLVGSIIQQQAGSHGVLTTDPEILKISWLFMFMSIGIYSLLAVAVFFLPLLGLHQILLREKEQLQAEANTRLKMHIQELHQRIDTRELDNADAMNKHLASLALERDILAKLPTWPWQPGTFNLIVTAVLLPVLLWLIQQLLERWTGI